MKSLTSNEPARQLEQEISDKCRKLPSLPKKPIVFFALLVEKSSTGEAKTQQQQLDTITTGLLKTALELVQLLSDECLLIPQADQLNGILRSF